MDKLSAKQRSENMRRIRSKDTNPELRLRSMIHKLGYRFRLHRKDLPGCPDIVFPGRSKVILVHGCFWHQHPGCGDGRVPRTHIDYWVPKFERNLLRDAAIRNRLEERGWSVLVVWECNLRNLQALSKRVKQFLEGN